MPKNRTILVAAIAALVCAHPPLAHAQQVRVTLANGDATPMDGRLLLIVSTDSVGEPADESFTSSGSYTPD